MAYDKCIGDILRAWRRHRGHSLVDTAELLGGKWPIVDVSRFERCANATGEYPGLYPSAEYLSAFAPEPQPTAAEVVAVFQDRFPDGPCVASVPD